MEGEFSLKRCLGHHCPKFNQLQVPLKTRVIRNAVWSHFETFTCHNEDEYLSCYDSRCHMPLPVWTCQFSKNGLDGHLMATGDEKGQLVLMDTRKRAKQSVLKEFDAHWHSVSELCWNRNGSELVTASCDRTLKLWDMNCSCKELSTLQGHQSFVNSVDVHREEPTIIVLGAEDGLVAVWDTRCNNKGNHHSLLRVSENMDTKSNRRHCYVTVVHFLGDNGILSSFGGFAGGDGTIKVWDKRSLNDPWHMFKTPNERGISAITVDTSQTTMFVSCMDSKIYAFDCLRFRSTPIAQYSGHTVFLDVKLALSPDDRYLLSGSVSNRKPYGSGGYIWEVNNRVQEDVTMSPLVNLSGQGPVTGVAWCPSQLSKVVTCSHGNGTWIWRTSNDSLDELIGHSEQSSPQVAPTTSPSNQSLIPKRMTAVKWTRQATVDGRKGKKII